MKANIMAMKKYPLKMVGKIGFNDACRHPGDVRAQDHEFAVGHVDDAHLPEDDGEPERHQHVDAKNRISPAKPCIARMEPRSPIE